MVESRIFADRRTAGIELGKLLEVEYKNRHALVIGIPKGGVEVAYHVAKILRGDLCAIVSKKLPFPGHEELAFGSVAEGGTFFLTPLARHLSEETINLTIENQRREISRRISKYREGRPLPIMVNRLVILVDDGIATGSTLVPALRLCRQRGAAKIVVAAPIAGDNYVEEIASLADEIKIVEQPDDFFGVGQAYECFPNLTDDHVKGFLEKFRKGI